MTVTSVLIVGAGPAGLVLALSLAQNGISVRIIDKEPRYFVGQRGAGIMPRSLELHNLLGTLPDILQKAGPVRPIRQYAFGGGNNAAKIIDVSPHIEPTDPIPWPNGKLLGQNNHEQILRSHLAKYGVQVELRTRLQSLEQDEDRVIAHLIHTKGELEIEETAEFEYLVGTDGAHSIVRKQLGLTFLGETRESENMVIGDIHVTEGLDRNFWHVWGDPVSGTVFLRPTENDDVCQFAIAGRKLDHTKLSSGRTELIEFIKLASGRSDIKFGDLIWLANYKPNIRMVDKFSLGRVFVAGDAAHVHSPTGGQGLNSSIQDTFNLGWKLALVIKRLSGPGLLETYNEERLPVIATMLKTTSEIHNKTFQPDSDDTKWHRGGSLNQLGVNYRYSSIVADDFTKEESHNPYEASNLGRVCAGDRAPDASGLLITQNGGRPEKRLFQIFGATCHTVLLFCKDPTRATSLLTSSSLSKYPDGILRIAIVLPQTTIMETFPHFEGSNQLFIDSRGSAYKNYFASDVADSVVVVRPDGIIGAIVAGSEGLERYFDKILSK